MRLDMRNGGDWEKGFAARMVDCVLLDGKKVEGNIVYADEWSGHVTLESHLNGKVQILLKHEDPDLEVYRRNVVCEQAGFKKYKIEHGRILGTNDGADFVDIGEAL